MRKIGWHGAVLIPLLWGTCVALPASASQLSAGGKHTCAVVDSGAQCWGENELGQLGNPAFGDAALATDVKGLAPGTNAGVTDISAGSFHTCAVVSGGVVCWGYNGQGQLGLGSSPKEIEDSPQVVIAPGSGVTRVSSGDSHTCALIANTVECWGGNSAGQLGLGNNTNDPAYLSPTLVPNLGNVTDLTVGADFTCAVVDSPSSGSVICWGQNNDGQLGLGNTDEGPYSPTLVPNIPDVQRISAGTSHVCALVGSLFRTVACWGYNGDGQLGQAGNSQPNPTTIPSFDGAYALVAGGNHTCAANNAGVFCWGSGRSGELGNGGLTDKSSPTPVGNMGASDPSVVLAAGEDHTCANYNGNLYCWGAIQHGQLGNGDDLRVRQPKLVNLGTVAVPTAISAGDSHTCVVVAGSVRCWGFGQSGQLGNGSTNDALGPVAVPGTSTASTDPAAVAAGHLHTCAVVNGGIRCWGQNASGQLGVGDTTQRLTPAQVMGISTAKATAVGESHSCALTTQGDVYCWGANSLGQLGLGNNMNPPAYRTPQKIPSISGATAISASNNHTCAVVNAGLKCWGENDSFEIGLGPNFNAAFYSTPQQVLVPNTQVSGIASGNAHNCAITQQDVRCWGYTYFGQTGTNLDGTVTVPTAVAGLGAAAFAIAAGAQHSCAVIQGGLACWGNNDSGQLGIGTLDDWSTFIPVIAWPPLEPVTAVAAGQRHTCAIINESVWCWGDSSNGRLGTFQSSFRTTPQLVIENDVIFPSRFELKP